jgi:hypothetical protein
MDAGEEVHIISLSQSPVCPSNAIAIWNGQGSGGIFNSY